MWTFMRSLEDGGRSREACPQLEFYTRQEKCKRKSNAEAAKFGNFFLQNCQATPCEEARFVMRICCAGEASCRGPLSAGMPHRIHRRGRKDFATSAEATGRAGFGEV